MKPKYKVSINDLETKHNIEKLEHDGHTRESIHQALYKQTEGLSQRERTNIIQNLYKRKY